MINKIMKFMTCLVLFIFACLVLISCGKDETAPVINEAVDGKISAVTIKLNEKFDFLAGVTATDEKDGNVEVVVNTSSLDVKKVGKYTVEYTATDAAGNIVTATREVNVVDQVAPFFVNVDSDKKMVGISVLQYTEKLELIDDVASVVRDNYDQEGLEITVKNNGGLNLEVPGEYTVTYQVKDKSGNAGEASRVVTVVESVKWVEDVIEINGESVACYYNKTGMFAKDANQGAVMRAIDQIQLMDKSFYVKELADLPAGTWDNNGGVPYLPYCVVVALDKDMNPLLIRNATYCIEAIKVDGVWQLHKNGIQIIDEKEVQDSVSFIDGTAPATTGVGIMGGNLLSYVPEDGYIMIASASKGGALDLGKILVLKNFLDKDFGGGAVTWAMIEDDAATLLPQVKVTYKKDVTTLYEKPAPMATIVPTIEKHILSFDAVTGASKYIVKINDEEIELTTNKAKMTDLVVDTEGAPKYTPGTKLTVTVQAISSDARFYTDSAVSEPIEYEVVEVKQLAPADPSINSGIISWNAIDHAEGYTLFANQGGSSIELCTITECNYDLTKDTKLANLIYNANIYVKVLGDGAEYLDAELSQAVTYMCSAEEEIQFADGNKFRVVETTVADYFGRRNDSSAVGYATKAQLYLIKDAQNIDLTNATHNEAYSFIVQLDKDMKVKGIINILVTTNQMVNGQWVTGASVNYTVNSKQIAPLGTFEEGDMLLIGKNGCNFPADENPFGTTTLAARDLVAHYYWDSQFKTSQTWRQEHTITEYGTFEVLVKDPTQLAAPKLSYNGSVISWNDVKNATSYEVKINNEVVEVTGNSFDLKSYVKEIGRSGNDTIAVNYTEVEVSVAAKAENMKDGIASKKLALSAKISDGTTSIGVTYNLTSATWNGGSGANFRGNDKVAVAYTGKAFKDACTTNASGYTANAGVVFLQNSIAVVLDKDMKVKAVRYAFVETCEFDGTGTKKTTGLTWANNGQNTTTGGGILVNLTTEMADDDVLLIFQNAGTKVVFSAGCALFANTNTAGVTGKSVKPSLTTWADTAVNPSNSTYSFIFAIEEK